MSTITLFAASFVLTGALALLAFAVLRGRLGEMPRLLLSPLLAHAAVTAATMVARGTPTLDPSSNWSLSALVSAGLWAVLLIVWAADEGRDLAPDERTPSNRWPIGLLGRHWRGEVPLWGAFWIVFILGGSLMGRLPDAVGRVLEVDTTVSERASAHVQVALWALSVLALVWGIVGTWRSATRRAAERRAAGRRPWAAHAARAVLALNVVRLIPIVISFAMSISLDRDDLRDGTDEIPPFSIRVMRGGTEAEISGGLRGGTARELARTLASHPGIRVLHLDSLGGWVDEGEKLFRLIRRHRLETYVAHECNSACTLAFAAGTRRWIGKEATVGFHAPSGPKWALEPREFTRNARTMEEEVYIAAGFDREFVRRAVATPHEDVLVPTRPELLRARVATDTASDGRFAASGWSIHGKEDAARFLAATLPVFDAIRERLPSEFAEMSDTLHDRYMLGKTEAEIFDAITPRMVTILNASTVKADDATQVEYLRFLADVAAETADADPEMCAVLFDHFPGIYALDPVSDDLRERRDRLAARAVRTAADGNDRSLDDVKDNYRDFLDRVRTRVGADDLELMVGSRPLVEELSRYCRLWIDAARLGTSLPERPAADIVRRIRR